jgi:hypothetical protein
LRLAGCTVELQFSRGEEPLLCWISHSFSRFPFLCLKAISGWVSFQINFQYLARDVFLSSALEGGGFLLKAIWDGKEWILRYQLQHGFWAAFISLEWQTPADIYYYYYYLIIINNRRNLGLV